MTVWMAIRVRSSLQSWTRPLVIYPVLLVQLLVAAGGLYAAIQEAPDEAACRREDVVRRG